MMGAPDKRNSIDIHNDAIVYQNSGKTLIKSPSNGSQIFEGMRTTANCQPLVVNGMNTASLPLQQ